MVLAASACCCARSVACIEISFRPEAGSALVDGGPWLGPCFYVSRVFMEHARGMQGDYQPNGGSAHELDGVMLHVAVLAILIFAISIPYSRTESLH